MNFHFQTFSGDMCESDSAGRRSILQFGANGKTRRGEPNVMCSSVLSCYLDVFFALRWLWDRNQWIECTSEHVDSILEKSTAKSDVKVRAPCCQMFSKCFLHLFLQVIVAKVLPPNESPETACEPPKKKAR